MRVGVTPWRWISRRTSAKFDLPVPQFELEDVAGVADLIQERFLAGHPHLSAAGFSDQR